MPFVRVAFKGSISRQTPARLQARLKLTAHAPLKVGGALPAGEPSARRWQCLPAAGLEWPAVGEWPVVGAGGAGWECKLFHLTSPICGILLPSQRDGCRMRLDVSGFDPVHV